MQEPPRPRRKLKVDIEELAAVLDDASGVVSYYLDLETGEVVPVTEDVRTALNAIYEELEAAGGEDEAEPGLAFDETLARMGLADWLKEADQVEAGLGVRYEPVPAAASWEGYRDMEDFIETVRDGRLQERLEDAIRGRGAFRRFREVLARFPNQRERWFQFKNARLRERALEWLEEMDIEPE